MPMIGASVQAGMDGVVMVCKKGWGGRADGVFEVIGRAKVKGE